VKLGGGGRPGESLRARSVALKLRRQAGGGQNREKKKKIIFNDAKAKGANHKYRGRNGVAVCGHMFSLGRSGGHELDYRPEVRPYVHSSERKKRDAGHARGPFQAGSSEPKKSGSGVRLDGASWEVAARLLQKKKKNPHKTKKKTMIQIIPRGAFERIFERHSEGGRRGAV